MKSPSILLSKIISFKNSDFIEVEKLIDTLLNENFAGDYTDAADELSKALRHVIEVPWRFRCGLWFTG